MNRSNMAAWTLAMIAVILNAAVGYYNIERMMTDQKKLQESLSIQTEYELLLSELKDAETGHRGFMLTGKDEYLKHYTPANQRVRARLDSLEAKISGRPKQQESLPEIRSLVERKFNEMNRMQEVRREKGLERGGAAVSENIGLRLMESLRNRIEASIEAEEVVLRERSAEIEKEHTFAFVTLVSGAILGLGIVLAAATMVNSELKRRHRANEELALAKSQAESALSRLDAFFENAPYGIAYLDDHLRILRINEAFAVANGMPASQHTGKRVSELPMRVPSNLLEDFQAALSERRRLLNRVIELPSGMWEMVAFPVVVPNGPASLGLIGVDITQRTRAENKLRESEASFRTLTESMPQMVWTTRSDGSADYFNSQWYEYTGLDVSTGDNWMTTVHDEDRERCRALWSHSVSTGEPYEIEYRLRRRDGAWRWFLGRGRAVDDEQGRIVRWLGTCTDIDDSKRLVETMDREIQARTATLVEQRTFLDAILNSVNEGIVACDAQGKLLFNRATQAIHGLVAERIDSQHWAEYYGLYEADGVTPLAQDRIPLQRAMKGELFRDVEMIIRPEDAPERFLLCSGQPLVTNDGHQFGAVVSMRDMTVRRTYEQELLEASRRLQASNEELEKFAYVASHDLQEPLRKIQAFGDRLGKKYRDALDDEGRDSLTRILDAAARMRRLIEDLLAFSRIATKVQPFELVDLSEVLDDVRSIFELRFDGGALEVGPLPKVQGDAVQLRQLFQNLIGNAIKFAKPGEPPQVRVHSVEWRGLAEDADPPAPEGNGWRLTIADRGIGFEQEYAERIFELFQRLHGRHRYEGTGLGLAIVKKIALRHGAAITARGQLGQGAVFILDWPSAPRGAMSDA